MTGPTKGLGGVGKEVGGMDMEEEVKEAYEVVKRIDRLHFRRALTEFWSYLSLGQGKVIHNASTPTSKTKILIKFNCESKRRSCHNVNRRTHLVLK